MSYTFLSYYTFFFFPVLAAILSGSYVFHFKNSVIRRYVFGEDILFSYFGLAIDPHFYCETPPLGK